MSHLNLQDHVTPNHWRVEQFDPHPHLSLDQEFDLVAALMIYFWANSRRKKQAEDALKKLRQHAHPLGGRAGQKFSDILNSNCEPDGLTNRYNALVMAIVHEMMPEVEADIDTYGAYSFTVGSDDGVLSGDASGMFALHATATSLRNRVETARVHLEEEIANFG